MEFSATPGYAVVAGVQTQSPVTLAERLRRVSPTAPHSSAFDQRSVLPSRNLENLSMHHALVLEEKMLELEQRDVLLKRSQHSLQHLREEVNALRVIVGEVPKLRSDLQNAEQEKNLLLAREKVAREKAEGAALNLDAEVRALSSKLSKESEANDVLDGRIRRLVEELAEREAVIAENLHQQQVNTDRLAALMDSARDVDARLLRAQADVREKHAMLQQSVNQTNEYRNELDAANTLIASLEAKLSESALRAEQMEQMEVRVDSLEGELAQRNGVIREQEERLAHLRGRLAQAEEANASFVAERESVREQLRRSHEEALVEALRGAETRLQHAVHIAEEKGRKACVLVEERSQRVIDTHSRELTRVQAGLTTALRLCRQYEESLQLAMGRIEEACIVHLGNIPLPMQREKGELSSFRDPGSPDSGLSQAAASSTTAFGKLNRSLGRILLKLEAVSLLRVQFADVVATADSTSTKACADIQARFQRELGRLQAAEHQLGQLQEEVRYGERRAILKEREANFVKIDALKSRLSNAEAELAVLHSHVKHLRQGKSDDMLQLEATIKGLNSESDRLKMELAEKETSVAQLAAHSVDEWAALQQERDALGDEVNHLQSKLVEMGELLQEVMAQRDSALAMEHLVVMEVEETQNLLRKPVEGKGREDYEDQRGGRQDADHDGDAEGGGEEGRIASTGLQVQNGVGVVQQSSTLSPKRYLGSSMSPSPVYSHKAVTPAPNGGQRRIATATYTPARQYRAPFTASK